MEEAEKEKAQKEVSKATLRDQITALATVEKRAAKTEKTRAAAEKRVAELEGKLGDAEVKLDQAESDNPAKDKEVAILKVAME